MAITLMPAYRNQTGRPLTKLSRKELKKLGYVPAPAQPIPQATQTALISDLESAYSKPLQEGGAQPFYREQVFEYIKQKHPNVPETLLHDLIFQQVFPDNWDSPDNLRAQAAQAIARQKVGADDIAGGAVDSAKAAEEDLEKRRKEAEMTAMEKTLGKSLDGDGIIGDLVRGAGSFVASLPEVPGRIVQAIGENAELIPGLGPLGAKLFEESGAGEKVAQFGKQSADFWEGRLNESRFSPEKEENQGLAFQFGSGIASLATALATGGAAGTARAAALFGTLAGSQQYEQAREKGVAPESALALGAATGVGEGLLEKVGLDVLLNPKQIGKITSKIGLGRLGTDPGILQKTLIRGVTEATQESLQQINSNAFQRVYDRSRWFFDDVGSAALIGGILGSGSSVVLTPLEHKAAIDNIRAKGAEVGLSPEEIIQITDVAIPRVSDEIARGIGQSAVGELQPSQPPTPIEQPIPQPIQPMGLQPVVTQQPQEQQGGLKPRPTTAQRIYRSDVTAGDQTRSHAGDWEVVSETPKTIKLKMVKQPDSIYGESGLATDRKVGDVVTIKKEGGPHTFEDFGDNTFQVYADQSGTPHYFEPVESKSETTKQPVKAKEPQPQPSPAPQESPEVKQFVDDYAMMLSSVDEGAKGGQLVQKSDGTYRRVSEHSPFYSEYFKQNKRAPSKQAYREEAIQQLESGKAAYGASEEYLKLKSKATKQADVTIKYPETKKLSPTTKEIVARQGDYRTKERLDKGKLSKGDLESVNIKFGRTKIKELARTAPEFKQKPTLTFVKKGKIEGKDQYGSPQTYDGPLLEFKYKNGTFRLRPDAVFGAFSDKIVRGLRGGEEIDFSAALTGKGDIPVRAKGLSPRPSKETVSSISDAMEITAVAQGPVQAEGERTQTLAAIETDKRRSGNRTPEQMAELVDKLNKAAQAGGILRRGGLRSRKHAGEFQYGGKRKGKEQVAIQDEVIKNPESYMTVLAHELSHAIEFNVNGDTKSTYKIFGELTEKQTTKIREELRAIVNNLEGEAVAKKRPGYFYKPTEMLARYVETLVLEPTTAETMAPTVSEKFQELIVREPMVADLVDAITNNLDKGFVNKVPDFWRDMRQIYRKHLGKRAGDMRYDAEVIRRAELQRSSQLIEELIDKKFKDVKDDPAQLFRAAEAVKVTRGGEPEFGTHDFQDAFTEEDYLKLEAQKWDHIDTVWRDGKQGRLYSKPRYTPEAAKAIFEELSPEGQQLIKDFTAAKEEAKDEFNREYIKDLYGIESNLEGWVHHFFEGKPFSKNGGVSLKSRVAAARKHRTGAEGYVEDFRKSMTKALLELQRNEINNEFIRKQLAGISKPIAKGQEPDDGWVEIVWDEKGGLRLPGQGARFLLEQEEGKSIKIPEQRFQVPANLAKHYQEIRHMPEEVNRVARVMNQIGKYWSINVLFHTGTTSTNFISGAVQYGAKVLNDFYTDVLTADVKMSRTTKNLVAPLKVLTPRGWSNSPDWLYGGYRSTMVGQLATGTGTKVDAGIDRYGNSVLRLYSLIERYWKKVIAISDGGIKVQSKEAFGRLNQEEKALVAELNKNIDLFAFDYDNKPLWMSAFDRKGGKLLKPFMTYPYKYSKLITNLATASFDKSLPWQERVSKTLTLATLMGFINYLLNDAEDKTETPEGTAKTPYQLKPGGRIRIGRDAEGREVFIRVAKYPFFNLTALGRSLVKGNLDEANDLLRETFGTVGPGADLGLLAIGKKDQFDQYKPTSAILGEQLASFIPGFRILSDIGKIIDPSSRKTETFIQGIGSNLPIWGSEEIRAKLRGSKRTISIPNEPETRSISEKSSTEREITREVGDILSSLLTGIYKSRISPEEAKQQELREVRNAAEQKIRDLLKQGNEVDAQAMASEYGLIIPEGSLDYYRRNREEGPSTPAPETPTETITPPWQGSFAPRKKSILARLTGAGTALAAEGLTPKTEQKIEESVGGLRIPQYLPAQKPRPIQGVGVLRGGNSREKAFYHAKQKYGWDEDELTALDQLIMKESGWNPRAQNPTSTAWGLFQFLDFNWPKYIPRGKKSTVEEQVRGGLKYIKERYNSPSNALRWHKSHNWY